MFLFRSNNPPLLSIFLFFLSFLSVVLETQPIVAETPQRKPLDTIIILDTSASMRGVGGNANIFAQVKETAKNLVNSSRIGDSIILYTFDSDITLKSHINITNNLDIINLNKIIDSLQANGKRTYMGKAIQEALIQTNTLNQQPNAKQRQTTILFLSDGLEDTRGIPNPISIPSNIQLVQEQGCQAYIFFVSLGLNEHETKMENFVQNPVWCGKGQVFRDPGAENLNTELNKITNVIIEPSLTVNLTPPSLDFGNIKAGESTPLKTVNLTVNKNLMVTSQLNTDNPNLTLEQPQKQISLTANQTAQIPIQLKPNLQMLGGQQTLQLVLLPSDGKNPITIPLTLTINAQLTLDKQSLDLGQFSAGTMSTPVNLKLNSNQDLTLQLTLKSTDNNFTLTSPQSLTLKNNQPLSYDFTLQSEKSAQEGLQQIELILTSPDDPTFTPVILPINFTITPPLWKRVTLASIPVVVIIILIGVLFWFKNRPIPLKGVLQIIEPSILGNNEIDLVHYGKTKISLKELLSPLSLDGELPPALIEIESVKEDKIDTITIRCQGGEILVNNLATPFDRLYNNDIIVIEKLKIQCQFPEHPTREEATETFS